MSNVIGSTDNAAFYSATQGLARASEGITQASLVIAGQNAAPDQSPSASIQPVSGPVTSALISLNLNSLHAQASAKVLGVADDTVGRLIDTLA